MTALLQSEQGDFTTFLRDMVAQNGDFATSYPSVFSGELPPEYALSDEDIELLLGHPERLVGLDIHGFHHLDDTLGRHAVEAALEDGLTVCATALQKTEHELPHMKHVCESLARAVGAPAIFAALHITPEGEWGSGHHEDIGWTLAYQKNGTKTWYLTPPRFDTLEEFIASRDPDSTDYIDGPHSPGTSITLNPRQGIFIPSGWGHAGIATGESKHISFGGARPNYPLASMYGD